MYHTENQAYPNSVTDCPTPSTGNLCLNITSGNTYSSYSKNNSVHPATFTLTASNGSNVFIVTQSTNPVELAPAPLSPVADWLALNQGDHYGNYYDLVGKQWATVSRNTTKTIYDPSTQHIYDVPINKLGINPRSDNKGGSEAVIEESRTNYLLNSSFSADSNSDGLADGWGFYNSVSGTPVASRVFSGIYGKAERVQYTGITGDSGVHVRLDSDRTVSGSFASGENAVYSAYYSGTVSGTNIMIRIYARNDSGSYLGTANASITLTTVPTKQTLVYSSLPAGTTSVTAGWTTADNIAPGASVDVSVAAAQVEKGPFATSYIPTTTATATRNVDSITVSTSSWDASQGTVFSIAGEPVSVANGPSLIFWRLNDAQRIWQYITSSNIVTFYASGGGSQAFVQASNPSSYDTIANRWQVGSVSRLYVNTTGYSGSTALAGAPAGLPSTAIIGNAQVNAYNGPIQRISIYNSALSDADILSVTNAIKDGPQ